MHLKNNPPFFYFTKKEKNGIFLYLAIILGIQFIPDFLEERLYSSNPYNQEMMEALQALNKISGDSFIKAYPISYQKDKSSRYQYYSRRNLFYFDPNELPIEQWRSFGMGESLLSTIDKYRKKGGRFYKSSDLLKIWGLDTSLGNLLIPFVRIKKQPNLFHDTLYSHKKSIEKIKKIIDINTADSSIFETLVGIGPILAKRIIIFRNKLGGFYDIDQLREVWGLKDSVFLNIREQLICNELTYKKINLNTCTTDQLSSHPYIGYSLGRALVNYRNQHGRYQILEDIQKIVLINKEKYDKIAHYLVVAE